MKIGNKLAFVVALVGLSSSPLSVSAAGAPTAALVYVGTVTDTAGLPLPNQQVKVAVFASATDDGSVAVCASKPVLSDALGNFSAPLDKCDAAVHSAVALWTEVTVGKTGATVLPRQRVTPVAYALEAAAAASASGGLAQQIADLVNKVGKSLTDSDLLPVALDVELLKKDVAALKDAPKTQVIEAQLTFGTGSMIDTPAGTLMATFSVWVIPQSQYAQLTPVFKLDGQKVGTTYGVEVQNPGSTYPVLVFVNAVVPVTAGKHFVELNNEKTGNYTCIYNSKLCPVVFTILP
jgi:hypothetical protein